MLKRTALILSLVLAACGGTGAGVDIFSSPDSAPVAPDTPDSSPSSPRAEAPVLPEAGSSEDAGLEAASDAQLPDAGPDAADAGQDADASDPPPPPPPPPPPLPPPPPTLYGVSFDRASLEQIVVPYPAGVGGSATLTVETWFNLRQPTDEGSLFTFYGGSCSYAGSLSYGAMVGHLNCLTRTGMVFTPATQVFSQQAITLGKWTHVALVLSAGKWTLFMDGKSQGTTVPDYGANVPVVNGGRFTIGGTGKNSNETIDGVVDEFRVSLTADYTADFAPPTHLLPSGTPSLALDEGMGTSVGGGVGTLVGGPSWAVVAR